jgi:ADP-heptose:LPS heptosyltransferase
VSAAPSRPRLLVLRALGLGDLLAGVPALRGLRRAFPHHELVLAAPSALREAVAAVDAVDRLLPAEAPGRGVPALHAWAGPPPDIAVDLHGNGPASRDALAALRPGRLLAFAGPHESGGPRPVWRPDEHERLRWCRLLAVYGIPADPEDLRLPPPAEASPAPGAVVVHPGANAAARCWPAERYASLVERLRAAGRGVVISGGPGDEDHAADLAARTGAPLHQGLPYRRFAALIAGAAALVSADTGPAHLAVAYGTPSVTLFGPVAPALWGPPPDGRHLALHHGGPPGDPNGPAPDAALLRITPDEVAAAVAALPAPGSTASRPRNAAPEPGGPHPNSQHQGEGEGPLQWRSRRPGT